MDNSTQIALDYAGGNIEVFGCFRVQVFRGGGSMKDIPYTSKLDHAEDGRPLALDYFAAARIVS